VQRRLAIGGCWSPAALTLSLHDDLNRQAPPDLGMVQKRSFLGNAQALQRGHDRARVVADLCEAGRCRIGEVTDPGYNWRCHLALSHAPIYAGLPPLSTRNFFASLCHLRWQTLHCISSFAHKPWTYCAYSAPAKACTLCTVCAQYGTKQGGPRCTNGCIFRLSVESRPPRGGKATTPTTALR
jgi:hypothetical protein